MEFDTVLFWIVCLSSASALVRLLANLRNADPGWIVVFVLILAVTGAGGWWNSKPAVYAGGALWATLVLVPALLSRVCLRYAFQQRYRAARRLAGLIVWLHPSGVWRSQPKILRALELADTGEINSAIGILNRLQDAEKPVADTAAAHAFRLANQWEQCIAWLDNKGADPVTKPHLIPIFLRASGETGDLRRLVNCFNRCEKQIARLEPALQRHLCRLILFAFCGRRGPVERLIEGPLETMADSAKDFWLATTDLAAGRHDEGLRRLSDLEQHANPVIRSAIERRRSHPLPNAEQTLTAEENEIVARADQEHAHEERFASRPSLFSRQSIGCQLFIVLNILAFLAEMKLGGSTDLTVLFRLGGLAPETVRNGQWWRLVAANFLHFGALHLTMNMLGLWALGPLVESSLGFLRFTFVYLLSGIGAMGIVLTWLLITGRDELLVGASACVMGLVGSTGAILWRGWQQQKARIAGRRLISVLFIVAMQTLFDWLIPQVSMMAHLSGVFIGFGITLLVNRRSANTTEVPARGA